MLTPFLLRRKELLEKDYKILQVVATPGKEKQLKEYEAIKDQIELSVMVKVI